MPDIREYQHLDELEDWILGNWDAVRVSFLSITDISEEELDRLELQEIIIAGEHGRGTEREQQPPLRLLMILDVDGEQTSQSDLFTDVASNLVDTFSDPEFRQAVEGFSEPTQNIQEEFEEIQSRAAPADMEDEAINRAVPLRQDDPNRAYSLSRDENIVVSDVGIERQPAGVRTELEEKDVEPTGEADILDFPSTNSFINEIENAFEVARQESASTASGAAEEDIRNLEIDRIVFMGEFGQGTAEFGVDKFRPIVFVSTDGKDATTIPFFSRVSNDMESVMENSITPTDDMKEWSSGIIIDVLADSGFNDIMENRLDPDVGRAVDVSNNRIISLLPAERAGFNVVEDPIEEPEEEEPEEEEVKTREEILEEKFPDIQPELRQFANEGEDKIEVPLNKDSKRVPPRPPHDFEKELYTPGDAGTDIQRGLNGGIGYAKEIGAFGDQAVVNGEELQMVPSTFPRTGSYVKNYLLYRGPSFGLQMYRDLVVYSAYISSIYNGRFVVGSYSSFREYLYRLKEVSERNLGPVLVRKLTPNEAQSRGLDTVPLLPSGDEATWLEKRQYWEVNQEQIEHPAWDNVSKFLYESQ